MTLKRRVLFLSSIIMLLAILVVARPVKASTDYTRDEAVTWVRSLIGQSIDFDNLSGAQCVDIIKAYYQYLGEEPVRGDGKDYARNALPSGWRRFNSGVQPQPGDIAYYTNGEYGHVFIVTGVDNSFNYGVHQNYNGNHICQELRTENRQISGLIRPDWLTLNPVAPRITGIKVSNLNAKGYDLSCTVTDDKGVRDVRFPTWTLKKVGGSEQDDLQNPWPQGRRTGDTFTYHVNVSEHKNESGAYITHIYAYDVEGNIATAIVDIVMVPEPEDCVPKIKDVQIRNLNDEGYQISCVVEDVLGISRVEFPTWTQRNGQDDLKNPWPCGTLRGGRWYFEVKTSDHKNESGIYHTHIYAYDTAGNVGSYRIESINVPDAEGLRASSSNLGVYYQSHVENIGWQNLVGNGSLSGTVGRALRLEGIKLNLGPQNPYSGAIQYRSHVQDLGWQEWKQNGEISGTVGQSKRLEAIKIQLAGDISNHYDVTYRVHVEGIGWMDWVRSGAPAGTTGQARRIEAIEVKLVTKNS